MSCSLANTPTPDDRPAPRPRSAEQWIEDPKLADAWICDPAHVARRMRRELALAVRQRCSDVAAGAGQPELGAAIATTDMEDLVR